MLSTGKWNGDEEPFLGGRGWIDTEAGPERSHVMGGEKSVDCYGVLLAEEAFDSSRGLRALALAQSEADFQAHCDMARDPQAFRSFFFFSHDQDHCHWMRKQ